TLALTLTLPSGVNSTVAPTAGPLSKDLVTSQVPTSSLALSFFSSLSSARTPAVSATATAVATISRSAFILLSLSERGSGPPLAGLRTWASAWSGAFPGRGRFAALRQVVSPPPPTLPPPLPPLSPPPPPRPTR